MIGVVVDKQSNSLKKVIFMLKEERYDKILEILEEETYVSAHKLSKMLFVSLPTIRRDLAELDLRKQIIRSHGGAKKIQDKHIVAPLDFRKTVNSAQKRRLCKGGASLVSDNDIVFIDASTSALYLPEFLCEKKDITVITNGIPLAAMLVKKGIKTLCAGGEIFENSLANCGSFTEEFIRKFNIDVVIFSCHGVTKDGMLCDPSLYENQIRKTAISQAKKAVLLCDESKLLKTGPFNLVHISDIDYIVTDSSLVGDTFNIPKEKNLIV